MSDCLHQSRDMYDEIESETGEIIYAYVEICKECNAVFFNDKLMGFSS